MVTHLITT